VPIANNQDVVQLIRCGLTTLMDNQAALGGLAYAGGQGQLQVDIRKAFQLLQATESLSPQWQQGFCAGDYVRVDWNSKLVDLLVMVGGEYLNVEQRHFVRGNPPPAPLARMALMFPPTSPYPTQVTADMVVTEGVHYDGLLPGKIFWW
jgi:hypothetical protein